MPRHLKGSKLNLSNREAACPDQAINHREWIGTKAVQIHSAQIKKQHKKTHTQTLSSLDTATERTGKKLGVVSSLACMVLDVEFWLRITGAPVDVAPMTLAIIKSLINISTGTRLKPVPSRNGFGLWNRR